MYCHDPKSATHSSLPILFHLCLYLPSGLPSRFLFPFPCLFPFLCPSCLPCLYLSSPTWAGQFAGDARLTCRIGLSLSAGIACWYISTTTWQFHSYLSLYGMTGQQICRKLLVYNVLNFEHLFAEGFSNLQRCPRDTICILLAGTYPIKVLCRMGLNQIETL